MKIIRHVNFYFSAFGVLVLLAMMFLTTSDVIGRFFFNKPITGAYEVTQYMLAVVVLSGIAYTQQVKANVRVTILFSRMPGFAQLVIQSVFTLLALVFFALLFYPAVEEGLHSLRAGGFSDMLHIPVYPFKLFVCVGVALISLELICDLIVSVKELKGASKEGGQS